MSLEEKQFSPDAEIKPKRRQIYEEVIREVAEDVVSRQSQKDTIAEIDEKPESDEDTESATTRRLNFFRTVTSRLGAMALAGFITLGGGWEKGFADQLKIKTSEKRGATPEFILQPGITKEKLEAFEEKLGRKEPEFISWLENYERNILSSIDSYENAILTLTDEQNQEAENKLKQDLKATLESFKNIEEANEFRRNLDNKIARTHKFLKYFKQHPDFLTRFNQKLKDNLHAILLGAFFLDDSQITRNKIMEFNNPPSIKFNPYDRADIDGFPAYTVNKTGNVNIVMTSGAFDDGLGEIDKNYYMDIWIHELIHALEIATSDYEKHINERSFKGSGLAEGITQNRTLEIIQYLSSRGVKLKIGFGRYDDQVLIAAIIEAMAKTNTQHPDFLSQWHAGIINYNELLEKLERTLDDLGLGKDAIEDFKKENTIYLGTQLIDNFLAKLKIKGIKISPQFMKSILRSGRPINKRGHKRSDMLTESRFQSMVDTEKEIRKNKSKKYARH